MRSFFLSVFSSFSFFIATAQDPVINHHYPYKLTSSGVDFNPGNYIFKSYIDFVAAVNDPFNPNQIQPFFMQDEIGVVISRSKNSGLSYKVDSITETYKHVLVYFTGFHPQIITKIGWSDPVIGAPRGVNFCIRLKKTDKPIIIMEATE